MIISRTPYRISFVGGGTDLRSFYMNEPGQVISTKISGLRYSIKFNVLIDKSSEDWIQ